MRRAQGIGRCQRSIVLSCLGIEVQNLASVAMELPHSSSPWAHLASLIPVIDLTGQYRDSLCEHTSYEDTDVTSKQVARRLYRSNARHVIITGDRGTGRTHFVEQLAKQAATGNPPYLAEVQFIWVDCTNVGPEDSRALLESLFSAVSGIPQVVLCLDGVASLFTRPNGGSNKPLLRTMAGRPGLRFIGIMTDWEYHEHVGSDAMMLDHFSRIELAEPTEEIALHITKEHATALMKEFRVAITEHVVKRTVALASTFILSECHPAKSIRLLRQVCEDADFDRSQRGLKRDTIEVHHVIEAISEKTGIPASTVAGSELDANFASALGDAVVGQEVAVTEVANELKLIKSGVSEPGKPASVLLFAGMTGVGKSELAKRIAELYSTSKRLQSYAMGNFTEPHSVSGIIGVPPGYVGHEDGGRLINDLNAAPYSVFLLDEAEKCHPNIWKPFLNLFDEGWIVDQRGNRAYADRAIFILTTNAGDRNIAQMVKSGKSHEEIAERVKQILSKVRHERSSQPVFPSQFLSRIKRIIVFSALEEEAMFGIARLACRRMVDRWRTKREKILEVSDEVAKAIGHRAHAANCKSNGQEGGRIVQRLVGDLVERQILVRASDSPTEYANCQTIAVSLNPQCVSAGSDDISVLIRFKR